jgi:hypothetical protein
MSRYFLCFARRFPDMPSNRRENLSFVDNGSFRLFKIPPEGRAEKERLLSGSSGEYACYPPETSAAY